eukprot:TRINITY_DN6394_c0_g1_i1.p1 TRINITY_DN6394_c0_g1~~TRINITY_DN6394_c0_g1_i1.p1  ORF type:complete len:368 (+),score=53.52 TRINITY_DN6394_c0_g1_i1:79-1182(+)
MERRACSECSRRKQRCDEKRPCSRCIMRHVPELCIYPKEEPVNPLSHFVSNMGYHVRTAYLAQDENTVIPLNNPFEIPPTLVAVAQQIINHLPRPLFPISYPFSGRENYYTSLWLQPRPESVLEIAREYPKRFSANYFLETLIDRPLGWKWLLHCLEFMSDPATTKHVHDQIIRKVGDYFSNVPAEATYQRFSAFAMVFSTTEKIHMSAEEEEIVKSLFGVQTLENCDIAITRSYEFLDVQDNHTFKVLVEANSAFENLRGCSLHGEVELLALGKGLFGTPSLLWNFHENYWPMIADIFLGSLLRNPAWVTDVVHVRNTNGDTIECLMHVFASYSDEGVRTALTWCFKPRSATYKPEQLLTKALSIK